MKNIMNALNAKLVVACMKADCIKRELANGAKEVLTDKKGEGYIDSAIKIIISVVVGGLLLAGLYALFNTTIIPTLRTKITEMFNYSTT